MKITIEYKNKLKLDKDGDKPLSQISVFNDGVEIATEDDHWTVEGRYYSIICDDSWNPVAFCENCFIKAIEYAVKRQLEQEAWLRSYPYMDPNLSKKPSRVSRLLSYLSLRWITRSIRRRFDKDYIGVKVVARGKK